MDETTILNQIERMVALTKDGKITTEILSIYLEEVSFIMKESEKRPSLIVHELKVKPGYFKDIENRIKTFEVRFNDRNFKVGDFLLLRKFDGNDYTGNTIVREICYILEDPAYVKEGFVILGIN